MKAPYSNPTMNPAETPTHIIMSLVSLLAIPFLSTWCQADPTSILTRIESGPLAEDQAVSHGCSWGDFDGDGWIDLFVANGETDGRTFGFDQDNPIYHNNGDGSFTKWSHSQTGDIAGKGGVSLGGSWADVDNDGDLDLFVGNWLGNADFFYLNQGAQGFKRVHKTFVAIPDTWTNSFPWADMDNDGDLDLFMGLSKPTQGARQFLFTNEDASFTKRPSDTFSFTSAGTAGSSWADFDNDGDMDLCVIGTKEDYTHLLRNEGGTHFTEIVEGDLGSDWANSSACDWGDFDNDGDLDLYVNGLPLERLFRNDGAGAFTLLANQGIGKKSSPSRGSCAWGDFDNDGWLDLLTTDYLPNEPNILYHNQGDGTFTPYPLGPKTKSSGCAWGDYDNDGFLDLYIANGMTGNEAIDMPNFLFHNEGNQNQWITVDCRGTLSNRDAIGTKVRVKATIGGKETWQMREIHGLSGWWSQSDKRAHFGLGDVTRIDLIRIEWPSGQLQEITDVKPGQILRVIEPTQLHSTAPGVFHFRGVSGVPYLIESSENLQNWDQQIIVPEKTSTIHYEAPEMDQASTRFYRVTELKPD